MSGVKYPNVSVQLSGTDGNVFSILGKVKTAIAKKHGKDAGAEFLAEALEQKSYDDVLALAMRTVEVS